MVRGFSWRACAVVASSSYVAHFLHARDSVLATKVSYVESSLGDSCTPDIRHPIEFPQTHF